MEKGVAKQDYNDIDRDPKDKDKQTPEASDTSDDFEQLSKIIEAESKTIYNFRDKEVSLSRLLCTDFKYNKRIHLPEPRDVTREAQHQTRKEEMKKVFCRLAKRSEAENVKHNRKKDRQQQHNPSLIRDIKKSITEEIDRWTRH